MIEIYEYTVKSFIANDEGLMSGDIGNWSIGLWFDDWEVSNINSIFLAWEDNDIVAFQTVNSNGETVAIEVKDSHQGMGISRMLLESSRSFTPEKNENPDFWGWVEQNYLD